MKVLNIVAFVLLLIGGLNWGLVGFFNFDLVSMVFGAGSLLTRAIFALVGLSALYKIFFWHCIHEQCRR